MENEKTIKYPLRRKMYILILTATIPLLMLIFYLLFSLVNYSNTYNAIVSNLTLANSYNLTFKENMDESIYKLAVEAVTFDNIDQDESLENPYTLINEARNEFTTLMGETMDSQSRSWLQSLLRNLDTLENRVKDIEANIDRGGQ